MSSKRDSSKIELKLLKLYICLIRISAQLEAKDTFSSSNYVVEVVFLLNLRTSPPHVELSLRICKDRATTT